MTLSNSPFVPQFHLLSEEFDNGQYGWASGHRQLNKLGRMSVEVPLSLSEEKTYPEDGVRYTLSQTDVHIYLKRRQETHNSPRAPPCRSPAVPSQNPGNRRKIQLSPPGTAVESRPEFPQVSWSQTCEWSCSSGLTLRGAMT